MTLDSEAVSYVCRSVDALVSSGEGKEKEKGNYTSIDSI